MEKGDYTMKKAYEEPEIIILLHEISDIISASSEGMDGVDIDDPFAS